MGSKRISLAELNAEIENAATGLDGPEYHRFSGMLLDDEGALKLAAMDPFSTAYREAAMALYLRLRGREDHGYDPHRDELALSAPASYRVSDLSPWHFKDPDFTAEFLLCWSRMMELMGFDHKNELSVLEYGPGGGQFLLMLAAMGIKVYGADIDQKALDSIQAQATLQDLKVETEVAAFGEGFEGQTFDRIVFFEAFHHAFDFLELLTRLKDRLKPGGKLVLCGEPVVPKAAESVPFPWGPRLDALSIYCMRTYGWMELGFTHDFLVSAFERTGWRVSFHPSPGSGRANIYLAERADDALGGGSSGRPKLSLAYKIRWKLARLFDPGPAPGG